MNLKKPKFWDYKKPNILAYFYSNFIFINYKLFKVKKKIKKSK
jgi:hypothetical protein